MKKDHGNLCGERIKALRKQQNLKQIDVSVALEEDFGITLDSTSLGRIERKERGVWDYELVALAKILGVSVLDLLSEADAPESP